ncbi:L-threonylcarbamoyladenylate synthase [Microlunatus capsulatus]|uniref:L-threonylcarbamoyladenylate synthase n=1 Tax=Microlunatus capsulatus TaxID=99117 RepID=A0ABS4Z3M4_9ACTN|nr:L-threonylcarbamoyladenylate synthase [Microlunatus capsulatus]MBP2415646.1 tRNA threonylcarbamoyl adenosine modification protein (Sua5/YciO/YrdC/YwlC family) [Microlunatus capsulatus]
MSEADRPGDPETPEPSSSDDAAAAFAAEDGQEHEFGSDEVADEGTYQRFDCTGGVDGLDEATEAARAAVEAGECIVLPTDTVYGIGADAFSADAVQRLLDAKMRGRDMPPPVLIGDPSLIRALATDVPDTARDLVAAHWPGALTVILKIQPSLRMDLGENEGTIALRVPDHELAREILRRTGPMAVSSANLSGKPAALTCDDAVDQLGDRVSVYLDGGELSAYGGAPSTIVDFTQHDHGEVLRRGALDVAVLRATLPDLVDLTEPEPEPEPEPVDAAAGSEPTTEPEPDGVADPVDPEPVPDPAPHAEDDVPAEPDGRAGAHALDPDAPADERPATGG